MTAKPEPKRPAIKGNAKVAATVAALAVAFVGGWEGLRLTAYRDIVGQITVCYGETRNVRPGDTHTKSECDDMLAIRLVEFERGLDDMLTVEQMLPQKTRVALVSWAYNVGLGAARTSTLVRLANARQWQAMCDQLPRWNKAGGRVVRGLTNRREAERRLCIEGLRDAGMIP